MATEAPAAPAPSAPANTPPAPARETSGAEADSPADLRKGFLAAVRGEDEPEKRAAPAPAAPEAAPKEPAPKAPAPAAPAKPEGGTPAAPETPPAEPEGEHKEVPAPKNLSPKAAEGWVKMNKELREKTGQLKRVEAELAEVKKKLTETPAPQPAGNTELLNSQLQQAQKERDDALREVAAVRLERTPEYQRAYTQPIQTAERQIADIAKAAGLNVQDALAIADEQDPSARRAKFKALAAELDPIDQQDFRNAIETLAVKRVESQRVLSKSRESYELVEKSRKAEQDRITAAARKQHDEQAEAAFAKTFDELTKEGGSLSLLKKIPGNDDWNKEVERIREGAIKIDRNPAMGSHEARASMIYQAIAYEIMAKAVTQYRTETDKKIAGLEEENKGLKESLARFVEATPNAGSSTSTEPPPPVDEKDDLSTRIAKRFEKETRPGK